MKAYVLVNPEAGCGRTGKLWPRMEKRLKEVLGDFEMRTTRCAGDGITLTREAVEEGARWIIAVGGDGTVNEVLNGAIVEDRPLNPEVEISMLMTGSGCDFERSFGFRGSMLERISALANEGTILDLDIGKVSFTNEKSGRSVRYFANIASFGLSGAVDRYLRDHSGIKRLKGKPLFLWATLYQVFTHPQTEVTLKIDDHPERKIRTRLGVVANGRFFGGGMHVAPRAELNDGLLDLMLLDEMSLGTFLRHLPKVYQGTHLDVPEIEYCQVRKVEFESEEIMWLDIDGESPGSLNAAFEVLPGLLKLRV